MNSRSLQALQRLVVPVLSLVLSRSPFARAIMSTHKSIRILALHGSGGNHREFLERLVPIGQACHEKNIHIEWIALDAPFPNGDHGYSWWTYGATERSSTAKEYFGFDDSAAMVLRELKRVDMVLAHSQGAILIAALLALRRAPANVNYLLNGVAWPNPYSTELETLKLEPSPKVFLVMGEHDAINPLSGQVRVKDCLERAGCETTVCIHSGGHSVPTNDKESLEAIVNWIKN